MLDLLREAVRTAVFVAGTMGIIAASFLAEALVLTTLWCLGPLAAAAAIVLCLAITIGMFRGMGWAFDRMAYGS